MKNLTPSKLPTRLLVLPVILVIAVFLAACGSSPETVTAPSSPPSTEEQPLPTFEPTEETESPATQAPSTSDGEVSFSKDILPILQKSCHQCHGSSRTDANLSLINYDQLIVGGRSGAIVVAGDADSSLLVQVVVSQRMPKVGPKLTPEQIQLITDWVNQGALDN